MKQAALHLQVMSLLVLAPVLTSRAQNSGFVTLEGRQFMVDGQPFYPMVMNFQFEVVSSDAAMAPTDLYVSASSWYGGSGIYAFECFNQPTCSTQIASMFNRIAAMGFNAIRIAGFATPHMTLGPLNEYNYDWSVRHNGFLGWSTDKTLSQPFSADPYANECIVLLRRLLDYADDAGLKAILICAEDQGFTPAKNPDAAYLYEEWLSFLSAGLEDHTALMAYDLWNEPVYSGPENEWQMIQDVKGTYCDYTARWYDAIRDSDPNHLITLGGANMAELAWWDPNAMKLDFYSPHMYPNGSFHDGYNVIESMNRMFKEIHWTARSCPMPFMIGETGFAADDGTSHTAGGSQFLTPDPVFHQWPYMNGSEVEQALFTDYTLGALEDYRGSGFSWWLFQNVHSMSLANAPLTPQNQKNYREGFYGALRFGGNYSDPAMSKLFADLVTSTYSPPQPTNALGPTPLGYYNFINSTEQVLYTYHIQDLDQQPIENAMVKAVWKYAATGVGLLNESLWDHCFSDANGTITVRGQDIVPGYAAPEQQRLDVDAPGAPHASYSENWEPDGYLFEVEQAAMDYEELIDGTVLSSTDVSTNKAWHRVMVSNTTVQGNGTTGGEFTAYARNVQLGPETHAQMGSEFHIKAERTFGDCSSNAYRSQTVQKPLSSEVVSARQEPMATKLQLQFTLASPTFLVFPNPAQSTLTIQLNDVEGSAPLVITDATGAQVLSARVIEGSNTLSVATLASGTYTIEVLTNGKLLTERFTKLP